MAGEYFPAREAELVTWSTNFSTLISAAPAQYGLTPGQAATFAGLHAAFVNAFQIANDPSTRTPSAIVTKNEAKEALVNGPGGIRDLVMRIQSYSGTTNAMRADLGITIRDTEPSPVPPPVDAPRLSIVAVVGRLIKVRLRDQAHPDRRGRPAGAQGAAILYHVGESPSNDPSKWALAQITSRATFDVEIPATVAPGSRVWLTAFWFNARKDSSPHAQPKSTIIGDGLGHMAA